MRLLPRTSRGTWLLAAAVWLGGCAAVWWLPSVPRLTVSAEGAYVVGFTTDGRWVQGRGNYSTDQPGTSVVNGPFHIWDPPTGRLVASWQKPDGATVLWPKWVDLFDKYAIVLFTEDGPDDRRINLYDLVTSRHELLPWTASEDFLNAYLAVGGRYLVFEMGSPDAPTVYWWDRVRQQPVGTFPGLTLLVVKPDGQWVTVEQPAKAGDPYTFIVREAVSGRESSRIVLSGSYRSDPWPDGDYLWLASSTEWQLFELPSGRPCLPPQRGVGNIVVAVFPDLHQAVSRLPDDAKEWLVRWDLTTGQEIGRQRLPSGFSHFLPFGRHLLLVKPESAVVTRVRRFLAELPLVGRIISRDAPAKWMIYDAATGTEVGTVGTPASGLSPDGHTLVYVSPDGSRLEFWDIPPRKPLTWLAVAAALWALPLAWLARRRVRGLQAAMA